MRFHHYLQKTDEELMAIVVDSIRRNNPHLRIGCKINAPVARVWRGKIVEERVFTTRPEDMVSLDYAVPHVPQEFEDLKTSNMRINFSQLEMIEWRACTLAWIYPRDLVVPHRKWLSERQPGQEVMVNDDQYSPSPYILTEKDFENHEYCIFRFGGSMTK